MSKSKHLGITTSQKLTWNDHTQDINTKSNVSFRFPGCITHSLSRDIKLHCEKTLVRSIFEYSSSVRDPHTLKNIEKLEDVKNGASRNVNVDYSSTYNPSYLIKHTRWHVLKQRQIHSNLVMTHKIINSFIDIPTDLLLNSKNSNSRGHPLRYTTTFCCKHANRRSFLPFRIKY